MAAPLAVAGPALRGVEGLKAALTGDILVLKGQVFRKVVVQKAHRKSKRFPQGQKEIFDLVPVDVQLHVNPVGISVGVLATGLALVGGWVAWNGLSIPGPFGPITLLGGIKDSPQGEAIRLWYNQRRLPREATSVEELVNTPLGTGPDLLQTDEFHLTLGRSQCEDLLIKYNGASRSHPTLAAKYKAEAKALGCGWAG